MKNYLFFLVFFVNLLHFGFGTDWGDSDNRDETGCPKIFKKKCTCKEQNYLRYQPTRNDTYVVNCTNSGFRDTQMLQYLPIETQVLIFNGNYIDLVPNNVFGQVEEHLNLKVIDFSNNHINEITGKAFHLVSSVEVLILNHNNLQISGERSHPRLLTNFDNLKEIHLTNAFSELVDSEYYLEDLADIFMQANDEERDPKSIRKIHLEQNEIWRIKDNLFCGQNLPDLEELYLGNNQLQKLDLNFECIEKLHFLDLSYNKIKRLSEKDLDRIGRNFDDTKKIDLTGNPYVCDCYLRPLFDWLSNKTTYLNRKNQMRCYTGTPAVNAGRRITNVKELQCPNNQNIIPSGVKSSVGNGITHTLLVILIILVLCLLVALLYINKERVLENGKLLKDNFQKSLQYRTIEKDLTESQIPPEVNV